MARKIVGRIRYEENYRNDGEHYVFELNDGEGWGLDTAFKLIDDRVSYTALTKIREWQKLGIMFTWK